MSLADTLNTKGVWPKVNRSKVGLWATDDQDQIVEGSHEGEGYVDPHPEGEDRGGYVVYWECDGEIAHYDEHDGEWLPG